MIYRTKRQPVHIEVALHRRRAHRDSRTAKALSHWHRRCFEARHLTSGRCIQTTRPERRRMSWAGALKTLSRRERLSEDAAGQATAALLDGGVPELEQGALLALLEARSDE